MEPGALGTTGAPAMNTWTPAAVYPRVRMAAPLRSGGGGAVRERPPPVCPGCAKHRGGGGGKALLPGAPQGP